MWLTKKRKTDNNGFLTGNVSISGEKCAVMGFSEHRNAAVLAPGGYIWKPVRGDDVLVFKGGNTNVLGKFCDSSDIEAGEVCIRSKGGAEIRLSNDGNIYIKGSIITEGEK